MIKIMIAEDNKELALNYRNFLTNDDKIEVISCTSNGYSTLEEYLKLKPDILLLDLDLPLMNGIEIVNELSNVPKERNLCNIIIISGAIDLRSKLLNTSKIFKILPKPCSFSELLCTIKETNIYNNNHINLDKNQLNSLLLKLSFNLYSKGTKYLIDCISIANDEPTLLYNISTLYTLIATQNHTTPQIIKWSICNSLSAMNRFVNKELLYSFFCEYDGRNLTPKYFITLLLNYISKN